MTTQRKPFILVIVGDSASGKTTLLGNLRRIKSIKSWVGIRDMDENGCPTAGREHWRKYRVEELLAESILPQHLPSNNHSLNLIRPLNYL